MTRATKRLPITHVKPPINRGAEGLDVISLQIAASSRTLHAGPIISFEHRVAPSLVFGGLANPVVYCGHPALPGPVLIFGVPDASEFGVRRFSLPLVPRRSAHGRQRYFGLPFRTKFLAAQGGSYFLPLVCGGYPPSQGVRRSARTDTKLDHSVAHGLDADAEKLSNPFHREPGFVQIAKLVLWNTPLVFAH